MAYKYSKGEREFGDLEYENDPEGDTKIDFDDNYIALVASGSSVLTVSGSQVGIGTTSPAAELTINSTEPRILFRESNSDRAEIFINDSDNLLINNMSTNKHIVFKVNDAGVIREGLRVNGMVPEVVVNEGSDSLVDFRVESNSNTHMLYVDGGNNTVGVNVSNPTVDLEVNGDVHISGSASFADVLMTELSIPGIDVTTDTNAYRFNCPYNLTVTGLRLDMDQHSTSGPVQVTVTNSTTSNTMITLSVTGTSLAGNTQNVTNASAAQGDTITFAITATPADVQGLRATLQFRRDL
jgi:hypothetical protein